MTSPNSLINIASDQLQDLTDFLEVIYMASAEIPDHQRAPIRYAIIHAQDMVGAVSRTIEQAREGKQ